MENIKAFIRIKPNNSPNQNSETNFTYDEKSITNKKTNEVFTFDTIISPETTNEELFSDYIKTNLSSILKGINLSIFAYGQTSTGKTYTMKGKNLNGVIPLSTKEIFSLFEKEKINFSVKISFIEIYNETVNDLIDINNKNLDIRESISKGIFVKSISEIQINDYDKIIELYNKGENNRIIAETKLNEKSSRSHIIFKINIEFEKEGKKYSSILNLIDLAGSENVSKAKCEGIRIKEGGNINKSLLALSNVINKLSNNNKNFVNYRDSKLTRLLQPCLAGNSKTIIICTIIDDNNHYTETLNTLHFGLKAKNVKTYVKINEIGKEIQIENQLLKNKIKFLQNLINKEKNNSNNKNNVNNKENNQQISQLEKEVNMLKKLILNRDEILSSDIGSINGDLYYNLMPPNNSSNRLNNSFSGMRFPDSALKFQNTTNIFNSPYMPSYHYNSELNNNNNFIENNNSSIRRSNTFNTEYRQPVLNNNPYYLSNKYYNNNNLYNNNNEFENDFLLKQNDDLKKNIYEMKKTYYDVIQNKENQIKLLNQNHSITLENCEKLIKEVENNYTSLKIDYENAMNENKNKEDEIKNLKEKNLNQLKNINDFKNEMEKIKNRYEDSNKNQINENINLKEKIRLLEEKLNNKNSEINNLKNEYENNRKLSEKEILKLKTENKNLKLSTTNFKSKKVDPSKLKIVEYENKINLLMKENEEYKNNLNNIENNQISEYQKLLDESFDKINELNKELISHKDKIKFLMENKNDFNNEENYIKTPIKEIKITTIKKTNDNFSNNNNNNNNNNNFNTDNINSINIENKENENTENKFLGKKKKLPTIYQNIFENNLSNESQNSIKESNLKNNISNFVL